MVEPLPIVIVPGNGYSYKMMKPFVEFLNSQDWCEYVVYIELLENLFEDLSYEKLKPESYSHYIYERLPEKDRQYIFYGSSMGCYHIQNFAADERYRDYVHSIIWLEPTMCGGNYKLLHEFETGRGNGEWLKELYDIPYEINNLTSHEKVMDIAVSTDLHNDLQPLYPLGIIYTTHTNNGVEYNDLQLGAKDGFIQELRAAGLTPDVTILEGPHSADVHPEYFRAIGDKIEIMSFWKL